MNLTHRISLFKGCDDVCSSYHYDMEKKSVFQSDIREISKHDKRNVLVQALRDIFLPQGYPESVSSDYLEYQVWDSMQAYFSNVSGALSLHSTLEGLGVGKESASTLAATVTWLLKDGTGMISSISFAYFKGTELDCNSKQWRLFADVALDSTNLLKLMAPFLPFSLLVTLCFSSIVLSLVGVAGSATRASLTQYQARRNNMADVAAKDGSQETMVNLLGLITSITILRWITSTSLVTWITFAICVIMHVYGNYKAMRALRMNTLNRPRFLEILHSWVTNAAIPDVKTINKAEPLFFGSAFISNYLTSELRTDLGCSVDYISRICPEFQEHFPGLLENFILEKQEEKYLLYYSSKKNRIFTLFCQDATTEDFLLSFWASYLCSINIYRQKEGRVQNTFLLRSSSKSSVNFVSDIQKLARKTYPELRRRLEENGWVTDPLRLNIGEWRFAMDEI